MALVNGVPGQVSLTVPLPAKDDALVAVRIPHYDSVILPAAATPLVEFQLFRVPIGQGYPNAAAGRVKTVRETTLKTANRLDAPEWFAMFGMHWEIVNPAAIALVDYLMVLKLGYIIVNLQSPKIRVEVPLSEIPSRVGVEGTQATIPAAAASTGEFHNGQPNQANFFQFAQADGNPFPINNNESLDFSLVFPTVPASGVAPVVSAAIEFKLFLDGYRNIKR